MTVLFEIVYKSPDDEAGNFEPSHLISSIQEQQQHNSGSIDDDQQMLLDIEQNIANLEKTISSGKQLICIAVDAIYYVRPKCYWNEPHAKAHR